MESSIGGALASGRHNFACWLTCTQGHFKLAHCTVTQKLNAGVTASFTLRTPRTTVFGVNDRYQISIVHDGDLYQTPTMAGDKIERYDGLQGFGWNIQLMDVATRALSLDDQSFPSFFAANPRLAAGFQSNSTAILGIVAKSAIIPGALPAGVNFFGMPTWPVPFEEVKEAKLADVFRRFLAVAGMDSWVDAMGNIVCIPARATTGQVEGVRVAQFTQPEEATRAFTGLRVQKTTPYPAQPKFHFTESRQYTVQLPYPMSNVQYRDESASGYIDQVCLFEGDPGSGGKLITVLGSQQVIDAVTVPRSGNFPATHASLDVYPSVLQNINGEPVDATIFFIGSIPSLVPPGVDVQFSVYLGTRVVPFPQTWLEPLIPSKAFAQARQLDYLYMRNRDANQCTAELSHLDLLAEMANLHTWRDFPAYRVNSIVHEVAPKTLKTTLGGTVAAA